MFPFLLLLGLGAFAVYELVPAARKWTTEHAKHIEDALLAHHIADQHLQASQATQAAIPPVPDGPMIPWMRAMWEEAIKNAQVATVANQVAALKTVDAVKTAKTDEEKQAAAKSADAVTDRQAKIDALKQQLGVGQCGIRSYPKVSARVRDALIARLKSEGMDVSGNNPWEINSHLPGIPFIPDVRLRALWDSATETLHLIVTSGQGGIVTCDEIWKKIEPKLKGIIGS